MGFQSPTTSDRYGARHQAERKRWAARVKRGGIQCARCGADIVPWEELHLDHDSADRNVYIGVSHAYCNTTEPARRRGRAHEFHWRNPTWV